MDIQLPRTLDALRAHPRDIASVEEELEDELSEITDWEAQDHCDSGWPEDEEVSVSKVEIRGDTLIATLILSFTEVIPSSCSDMPRRKSLVVTLPLRINATTGDIEVGSGVSREDDSDEWDTTDFNSANDGC